MANKKKLILIGITIVISILILVTIGINFINVNKEGIEIKKKFEILNKEISEDKKEYPKVKIPRNNILKYINTSGVLEILDNEKDAVIYIGKPSCIYCRPAIEVLINTAKKTKLDVIYYLEIDEKDINYNDLITALGEELTYKKENETKIYEPLVLFITDGRIISYNIKTISLHKDPYEKLSDEQKKGLSAIYKYGIRDVVSSKKLKEQ